MLAQEGPDEMRFWIWWAEVCAEFCHAVALGVEDLNRGAGLTAAAELRAIQDGFAQDGADETGLGDADAP